MPDVAELVGRGRQMLRRQLPELRRRSVAVLYGPVSPEDRLYSASCPRSDWSATLIETLDELGIRASHVDPTSWNFLDRLASHDTAFVNVHGEYGEDGRLQGLLDYLQVPYTGSGVLASSVGCDKAATKAVFALLGIPTPAFELVRGTADVVRTPFGFPVMVKAADGGSSVGTVLVDEPAELAEAWEAVRRMGSGRVLVEEFVPGRSVTVGLVELPTGPLVLPVLECVAAGAYYDRDAKLHPGTAEYRVPAELPGEVAARAQEAARAVYEFLGCRGAVRVDFVVDPDRDAVAALEINTVPGLQRASNIVVAGAAVGLSFEDLVLAVLAGAGAENRAPWLSDRAALAMRL